MAARVGGGRRHLSGAQKVALFLRLLDEETAAEILRHLGDDEVARIHRADTDLGDAEPELIREVARELGDRLRQRLGGAGTARFRRIENALRKAFDEERLRRILDRARAQRLRLDEVLADVDVTVLARVLSREYPQTAALVLSQLPPGMAATMLRAIPDDLRVEILARLARLDEISEEMLGQLAVGLQRELAGLKGSGFAQSMMGLDRAVQILMQLDRATENALLEALAERDEEVAEQIREHMFTFDDLLNVDDRGIQTVLRNIETRTLVLALKGASEEIKEKFLKNVSQRVAASILEDLETLGPVRLSEVEAAQQAIANAARELIDRGEIMVAGRGEDVVV